MRAYLDAAPVVYLVERIPGFYAPALDRLSDPGTILIASHLTRMECKVGPVRNNDLLLTAAFEAFFTDVVSEMAPLTQAVFDRATSIRATYGFTTPDCIHLAAATVHGCDAFLTNDHRLQRYPDVRIMTIHPQMTP